MATGSTHRQLTQTNPAEPVAVTLRPSREDRGAHLSTATQYSTVRTEQDSAYRRRARSALRTAVGRETGHGGRPQENAAGGCWG